jgi:hypothetical protein
LIDRAPATYARAGSARQGKGAAGFAGLFEEAGEIFHDFRPRDVVLVSDDADLDGADRIADEAGEERIATAADQRRGEGKERVAGPDGVDDLSGQDGNALDVAAFRGNDGPAAYRPRH